MNVIVTSSAQSSADTTSGLSPPPSDQTFIPENKGLVGGICTCYNNHFDLDLTPDVVWLSILQQFSAYINGGERAEALRDRIVDFQGKKELVVCAGGSLFGAPYSLMTNQVAEKITENIKDPTIREWADPGFSTSTLRDKVRGGDRWSEATAKALHRLPTQLTTFSTRRFAPHRRSKVAASVSLMSIMQNYFTYSFMLMFGIPTVTLKGTQKDWEKLRLKVDRLLDFDLEDRLMTMLHEKLSVVCDNFVSSRKGEADLDVWDTVCHKEGGGSGPSYLGGWITCFNLFDHKGELAIYSGDARFGSSYTDSKWWKLDTSDISDNVISVSISVNDNGIEYSTRMFIGTFVSNFDVDIDRGVKEARALKKQNILGKKTVVGPR